MSLSVPPQRHCYGDGNQFIAIIEVLVKVLDSSRNLTEFSEFKYQETLQEQVNRMATSSRMARVVFAQPFVQEVRVRFLVTSHP